MILATILLGGALLLGGDSAAMNRRPAPDRTGCIALYADPDRERAETEFAQKQLLEDMRDPESAKLSSVHYARIICDDGPHDFVCGSVNAKNGFGGYTGKKLWVYIRSGRTWGIWSEETSEGEGEKEVLLESVRLCVLQPKPAAR